MKLQRLINWCVLNFLFAILAINFSLAQKKTLDSLNIFSKVPETSPINLGPIRSSSYLYINSKVEFIKTDEPISFDAVRSEKYSTAFTKTSGEDVIFIGYDPDHYWFRFRISNEDSVEHDVSMKARADQIKATFSIVKIILTLPFEKAQVKS
jgi:hypothetical protein